MIMIFKQDSQISLRKRMAAALRLIQTPANRCITFHNRHSPTNQRIFETQGGEPECQEEILLVCKFSRMVRRHKSQRAAILYRVSANPSADLQ